MSRSAPAVVSLLLLGCASAPKDAYMVHAALEPETPCFAADAPAGEPIDPEMDPALFAAALALPARSQAAPQGLHRSRFTIKGGTYDSEDDGLDDGYIVNLSWMNFFSKFFATEFELGYFDADGAQGAFDTEAWGIPFMVNGRFNVPLWVLDVYAGVGIGSIYYDAEAQSQILDISADGFLFAGNAFLGATINLADSVALGIEGKYYETEDISEFDSGLDAYALMLTLGLSR